MNVTAWLHRWSERHQVAAIVLATAGAIVLLWMLVLAPQNLERRRLEREIEALRAQLAAKNFLVGEDVLREHQRVELERGQRWAAEWAEAVQRMALADADATADDPRVGHIDFKIALYEARYRLLRKARSAGLPIPVSLGMEDTVPAGEDAHRRLLQLRAVERVVDVILDLKTGPVEAIEPLPVIRHPNPGRTAAFLEELPVRIQFETDLERLREWLRSTRQTGRALALRQVRIDGQPEPAPSVLRVTAVVSALMFPGRLEDHVGPLQQRIVYTRPLGH